MSVEVAPPALRRDWSFVIENSFVIGHAPFVIHPLLLSITNGEEPSVRYSASHAYNETHRRPRAK
jgi:hypothetical protein